MLATLVADKKDSDRDFFPLTVNYIEKTYAAGKIPGGFFKREGRPTENETLISRLVDRPLRPLFDPLFTREVQLTLTLLSHNPAIGIRVRKWVAYHGFSININNDLEKYKAIIPCGIKDKGVTNLKEINNQNYDDLEDKLLENFINNLKI